jgi:hypothetical protein
MVQGRILLPRRDADCEENGGLTGVARTALRGLPQLFAPAGDDTF